MSQFEIVAITLSFIVGLGIAQLLTSFSEAIRSRIEHPLHWMPFAWGIPVLLLSVQYWFALFDMDSTLMDWNWLWYLQMLAMAMALFMASALILPPREAATEGGLVEDFTTHGRYSLLALVAYLLGWIPANAVMNNGNVLEMGNIANAAMAVPALIAFRSRSSKTWIVSTIAFYVIFAVTFFGLYSTPGSEEGFLRVPAGS
ncbi:MAG: hypothetical protein OEW35_12720 [Gammaproteobacteria bacterium]|nr:hypothetical protein [Gammaproteobacteria bacterium]MDH4255299.1 hypothetical protein [Gammaproteobacteria bacterium]MDH5310939.1 hypothetical protein [Gammaproteobacteria bacterium]